MTAIIVRRDEIVFPNLPIKNAFLIIYLLKIFASFDKKFLKNTDVIYGWTKTDGSGNIIKTETLWRKFSLLFAVWMDTVH